MADHSSASEGVWNHKEKAIKTERLRECALGIPSIMLLDSAPARPNIKIVNESYCAILTCHESGG